MFLWMNRLTRRKSKDKNIFSETQRMLETNDNRRNDLTQFMITKKIEFQQHLNLVCNW